MQKKLSINISCVFIISFFYSIILAQKATPTRHEVLEAINETSNYASTILLDENGKSRCDYVVTEGKWYDYEPPWHTGQIINALVEAYKLTKNKEYLKYAKKAGDWWCKMLIKDNPKLNGMVKAIHGDGINYIVFATITDGTPGLFNLYKVTGDKKYADVPTSVGKWMLANMYVPDQKIFYDAVDPVTGEVMKKNSPFWPEKSEQTLYDVARPNNEGSLFKDMYLYTKDETFRKIFIDLCESLVEKQDQYGLWMDFMPNNKNVGTFHPRFNLWYAESLLDGFDLTGDKRFLDAAKKTMMMYKKVQKKDGTIFFVNYVDGKYNENSLTGSAIALAGSLWIRLAKAGFGEEFKDNIERSASWILENRFSANHPDKNLRGAVLNLRTRRKNGKVWIAQRDIGTSFGIRFLVDYFNYKFSE
jgi:hypothetical protein